MSLSIDLEINRIQRCSSTNEQSVALQSAEREIGHHLRNLNFTDEFTVLSVAQDTFGTTRPQAVGAIDAKSIEKPARAHGKHLGIADALPR